MKTFNDWLIESSIDEAADELCVKLRTACAVAKNSNIYSVFAHRNSRREAIVVLTRDEPTVLELAMTHYAGFKVEWRKTKA